MQMIKDLGEILGVELRAVVDFSIVDCSFDYEYGSEKGTHHQEGVEINEVTIEAYDFSWRTSRKVWQRIDAEGIKNIVEDYIEDKELIEHAEKQGGE